ncbi:TRAP transporter TatT component family protein [Planctobacterium marinum]|uniref:TRAP transporter TatT component family protein n=1 Tax=Planctobacterium marinum TaxID=1631968 RepID=A0AA48HM42_9ALTE|nr:hypothetical protein MACH26_28370 [Planctobacterium marinum]
MVFNKRVHSSCALLIAAILGLSGCSSLISGATKNLASQLQDTISNHNDPEVVKAALPAYMLLLESMQDAEDPSVDSLTSAAQLYVAYSAAFVTEPDRQKKLSQRGFNYAKSAICTHKAAFCGLKSSDYASFLNVIEQAELEDVPVLGTYGTAWGTWLKANSDDFNAVADLPKITRLMERLVALDDDFQQGNGHLYLGIIHTLTPPAVGGKPELARKHFERAIEISQEQNLMMKVTYAQQYARMLFNRELHDKLLTEVVNADPVVPGLTLNNTLAQDAAKALLNSAEDYF